MNRFLFIIQRLKNPIFILLRWTKNILWHKSTSFEYWYFFEKADCVKFFERHMLQTRGKCSKPSPLCRSAPGLDGNTDALEATSRMTEHHRTRGASTLTCCRSDVQTDWHSFSDILSRSGVLSACWNVPSLSMRQQLQMDQWATPHSWTTPLNIPLLSPLHPTCSQHLLCSVARLSSPLDLPTPHKIGLAPQDAPVRGHTWRMHARLVVRWGEEERKSHPRKVRRSVAY